MTDPPQEQQLSDRLSEAFSLASKLHRGQVRKRAEDEQDGPGIPYIAHLMAVATLVLEHGGNEDEAIAALLLNGPEDQGGRDTLWEIKRKFGKRVVKIVGACSDTLVGDPDDKPPWRARKEQYLDHLRKTTSESIFLVSVADKVHNLRSILADYRRIGDKLWDRFTGKRDGTLWYYEELLKVYKKKAPARCADLVKEFERTHRELIAVAGQATDETPSDTRPSQPSARSARLFNYHEDDWKNEVLTCRTCGWTGTFEEGSTEVYSELMDSHCPKCHGEDETMLAIVSWSP